MVQLSEHILECFDIAYEKLDNDNDRIIITINDKVYATGQYNFRENWASVECVGQFMNDEICDDVAEGLRDHIERVRK